MKKFNTTEEIKALFDTGKWNIHYDDGDSRYEVRNLGSTVYCFSPEHTMGMGGIHNFDPKYFWAEPKPVPVQDSDSDTTEVQED